MLNNFFDAEKYFFDAGREKKEEVVISDPALTPK